MMFKNILSSKYFLAKILPLPPSNKPLQTYEYTVIQFEIRIQ